MTELRDDVLLAPDPSFNPNVFSEDEEEERPFAIPPETTSHSSGAIPIAPMTPKNLRQTRGSRFLANDGNGFIRARAQQRMDDERPTTSRAVVPPRPPDRPRIVTQQSPPPCIYK